jgi:hypothetical protein
MEANKAAAVNITQCDIIASGSQRRLLKFVVRDIANNPGNQYNSNRLLEGVCVAFHNRDTKIYIACLYIFELENGLLDKMSSAIAEVNRRKMLLAVAEAEYI